MNELVGRKMLGFKFSGSPGFTVSMGSLIGKKGKIIYQHPDSCTVQFFKQGALWSYPYPEILNHLVDKEDERTIDQIINDVKQLTSELWKTKI